MATANSSRSSRLRGLGDYGIKISKDTRDVSEAERYMIMNTKYPVLKLKQSGQGVASKAVSAGGFTVTIPHNLGYIPVCFVSGYYFDTPGEAVVEKYSDWNKWIYQGLQVADLYNYYADETNLYIELSVSYLTDDYAFDLNYMYHIFYDEEANV